MVVAQNGYQDHEYDTPKKLFTADGFNVTTASSRIGECQGKLGGTTTATLSINHVNVAAYDAVVFVGGPGAIEYQHDQGAHKICQNVVSANKVLAAICIAPLILAQANVLNNKQATVWNEDGKQAVILEDNGATFIDQDVVKDEKIITANGPEAAKKFGKTIIKELA